MTKELNAYQKTAILGKSQLELIIQVYDGAIAALKDGQKAYQGGDNEKGYQQLEKARRFVPHLYTTLDPEKGGEIAERLAKLYAFVINQTNVVQATKDSSQIDDNITVLRNLRLGWVGLKEQQDTEDSKDAPGAEKAQPKAIVTTA